MKSKVQAIHRVNYEQVDTIVASDMVFLGDISAGGSMRFEGNIRGNITISGNLIIGRNALVVGDIQAKNIHVIGTVEGDIKCEQLRILSTGKITGDAHVQSIIVDEGAVFIGNCKTYEAPKEEDPSITELLDSIQE